MQRHRSTPMIAFGTMLPRDAAVLRKTFIQVMAQLPVWAVAVEKLLADALQGLVAAVIVFPLALFVPATPVELTVRPLELVTLLPLACAFR